MKRAIAFADDAEFDLARGAVISLRAGAVASWKVTTGEEQAFHRALMDRCDRLTAKFEAVLISDTSQDPEPEDDD